MAYIKTKDLPRLQGTARDLRRKLSEEQREEIRRIREAEGLSTYRLAEMFGVSRRTIDFVLNPEKLERSRARRRELARDGRYRLPTALATEASRRSRERRRRLAEEDGPC